MSFDFSNPDEAGIEQGRKAAFAIDDPFDTPSLNTVGSSKSRSAEPTLAPMDTSPSVLKDEGRAFDSSLRASQSEFENTVVVTNENQLNSEWSAVMSGNKQVFSEPDVGEAAQQFLDDRQRKNNSSFSFK